jgi:hypothetical protein
VQVQSSGLAAHHLAEHDPSVAQLYALEQELASCLEGGQLVVVSSFGSYAFHDWEQAVFRQQEHLQLVSEQSLVDSRPGVEQAKVVGQAELVSGRDVGQVGQLEDVQLEGVVREQLGLCCQQRAFWVFDH